MPGPYSAELRARVIAAYQNDEGSVATLAERFMVGTASIDRWLKKLRETQSFMPSPMGGARRPYKVHGEGAQAVCDLLDSIPDATLMDACEVHFRVTQIEVPQQTMSLAVRRLGYTKKRGFFVRSGRSNLKP